LIHKHYNEDYLHLDYSAVEMQIILPVTPTDPYFILCLGNLVYNKSFFSVELPSQM